MVQAVVYFFPRVHFQMRFEVQQLLPVIHIHKIQLPAQTDQIDQTDRSSRSELLLQSHAES